MNGFEDFIVPKTIFFNPRLDVHAIYNKNPSINKEMISSTYGQGFNFKYRKQHSSY